MDLTKLPDWCRADPGIALLSTEPAKLSLRLAGGQAVVVDAGLEGDFFVLSAALPLSAASRQRLADAALRERVAAFLSLAAGSRPALAQAAISADGATVGLRLSTHQDGLNAHTFLLAVKEMGTLAATIDPDTIVESLEQVAEAERAGSAAQQLLVQAEADAERRRAEEAAAAASTLATIASLKSEVEAAAAPAVCSNCQRPLTEGARFCLNCGAPVAQAMVPPAQAPPSRACRNCGAPLADGARFCVSCGAAAS
jgi:RNA polymerase subunit RPABC4/transcription elongation factor Spt4